MDSEHDAVSPEGTDVSSPAYSTGDLVMFAATAFILLFSTITVVVSYYKKKSSASEIAEDEQIAREMLRRRDNSIHTASSQRAYVSNTSGEAADSSYSRRFSSKRLIVKLPGSADDESHPVFLSQSLLSIMDRRPSMQDIPMVHHRFLRSESGEAIGFDNDEEEEEENVLGEGPENEIVELTEGENEYEKVVQDNVEALYTLAYAKDESVVHGAKVDFYFGKRARGVTVWGGNVEGSSWGLLKARIIIRAPAEKIAALIYSPTRVREYDDMADKSIVIRTIDGDGKPLDHTQIRYVTYKSVWPTTARDFVILAAQRRIDDIQIAKWEVQRDSSSLSASNTEEISSRDVGTNNDAGGDRKGDSINGRETNPGNTLDKKVLVQVSCSVEHGDYPVKKNYVRGDLMLSGYAFVELGNGETEVTLISWIDLKGSIPGGLLKSVAASAPIHMMNQIKKIVEHP